MTKSILEQLKADAVWAKTKYNMYDQGPDSELIINWDNFNEEDIISFDQENQKLVIKYRKSIRYFKKGLLHRENGPAVCFDDNSDGAYFLEGKEFLYNEFKQEAFKYKTKHNPQYIEITAKYLNDLLLAKAITKQELMEYDSNNVEYWKENYDPEFLEIGTKWQDPVNGRELTVWRLAMPSDSSPPSVVFTYPDKNIISFPIKQAKTFTPFIQQLSILEQLKQDPVWKDARLSSSESVKWTVSSELKESDIISWDPDKEELIVKVNNATRYLTKGKLHRDNKPAIEFESGANYWLQNSLLHREDGPAEISQFGMKYWYLNGKEYSEQEYHTQPNKDLNYLKQKIQEKWKGTELETEFPNITEYLIKDDIVWFRADLNNLPYHHCFKNNFRYGKPIYNQQQYSLKDFEYELNSLKEYELKRDEEQKIQSGADVILPIKESNEIKSESDIIDFLKNDPTWSKIKHELLSEIKKDDIVLWDKENNKLILKQIVDYNKDICSIFYFKDAQLHNDDGPARIDQPFNDKYWYQRGYLHRNNGPAIEKGDGQKSWYQFGQLHRLDGPAREWKDGRKEWRINGLLHREDGPAAYHAEGYDSYYLNGICFSKENFEKELILRDKTPKIKNKSETNQAFSIIAANQCKKAFHTILPTQYLSLLDSKLGSEMLHYLLGHVGQSKLPQYDAIFKEIKIESLASLQDLLIKSVAESISSLPEKEDQITQTIHQSYTDHA